MLPIPLFPFPFLCSHLHLSFPQPSTPSGSLFPFSLLTPLFSSLSLCLAIHPPTHSVALSSCLFLFLSISAAPHSWFSLPPSVSLSIFLFLLPPLCLAPHCSARWPFPFLYIPVCTSTSLFCSLLLPSLSWALCPSLSCPSFCSSPHFSVQFLVFLFLCLCLCFSIPLFSFPSLSSPFHLSVHLSICLLFPLPLFSSSSLCFSLHPCLLHHPSFPLFHSLSLCPALHPLLSHLVPAVPSVRLPIPFFLYPSLCMPLCLTQFLCAVPLPPAWLSIHLFHPISICPPLHPSFPLFHSLSLYLVFHSSFWPSIPFFLFLCQTPCPSVWIYILFPALHPSPYTSLCVSLSSSASHFFSVRASAKRPGPLSPCSPPSCSPPRQDCHPVHLELWLWCCHWATFPDGSVLMQTSVISLILLLFHLCAAVACTWLCFPIHCCVIGLSSKVCLTRATCVWSLTNGGQNQACKQQL